jgi:hypothetical protein
MLGSACVVMLAVAGCGALPLPPFLGNQLTGSVGSRSDLSFDEVEIRKYPTGELQVRYKRTANGNNEIVAQVTVTIPQEGFTRGKELDLKSNSGTVTRAIQNGDDFPPLKSGSIRIDTGGVNDGDATRGRFSATFDNDRTLNGNFDGKLSLVNI